MATLLQNVNPTDDYGCAHLTEHYGPSVIHHGSFHVPDAPNCVAVYNPWAHRRPCLQEFPRVDVEEIPYDLEVQVVEEDVHIKVIEEVTEVVVEVPYEKTIEKIVEIEEIEYVEFYVDRLVEVTVERIVQIPVQKYVEVIREKIVEKPHNVPVRTNCERHIELLRESFEDIVVERFVTKIVEVPYERVVTKYVEVPYEKIIEKRNPSVVEKVTQKEVKNTKLDKTEYTIRKVDKEVVYFSNSKPNKKNRERQSSYDAAGSDLDFDVDDLGSNSSFDDY